MATIEEVRAYVADLEVKNISSFLSSVRLKESTDNYQENLPSSPSYVGAYQLGRQALSDIEYVSATSGMRNDPSSWIWTGKNGVDSLDEYLGINGQSQDQAKLYQDAAFLEYGMKNWSYFRGTNYEFWGDQTLNDFEMSISGLIMASHLVGFSKIGWGGTIKNPNSFINSGGTSIEADGNGTLATTYLEVFGNFDLSDFRDLDTQMTDLLPNNFWGYFTTNPQASYEIVGGTGNDILSGFGGEDTLKGGGGNDTIYGGSGNNTIDGGSDEDTLVLFGFERNYTITNKADGSLSISNIWNETDIVTNVEQIIYDAESCFPAGTLITLDDGSQKAIENISMGDAVLSFDNEGNKVAGRVTQLLDNVTDTWLKLSRTDDADWSTVVTPGHRYLTPDGSYEEIKDIVGLGGGSGETSAVRDGGVQHNVGRIVDVDGHVVEVSAEAIHYSAANADLFEQHAMMKTWSSGGLAMEPQYVEGWRTYNFTVETHHNYVAENIRVHNDSVLSTLEDGDTLISLDETYNHVAVLRDVDGDDIDEVVINEGTHSDEGNYILIREYIYEPPSDVTDTAEWLRIGDPNKTYDGIEDANGKTYTGDDGETKTIDLYSNPLDPGFGNEPADGVTSDDLREIMKDDLGFTETITPGRFMHFGLLVERITYVLKDVLGNEVEYGDSGGGGGFGGIGGGLVSPFGAAVETFFTLVLEDGSVVETSLLLDDDLTDFGDITSFILANGTTTAWSDLEITPEGGIATNTPPVAVDDDDFTTSVDTVLDIPVDNLLANDSDADGDTLSIISVQDGVNGTPTLNADGSINFMPDIEFSGDASFTYTVSDDNGGEATATVNIIVDVGTAKIVITGTDGDDYISTSYTDVDGETPSNEGETIEGLGGNDRIYAFAGDDTMLGGDGDDYMRGYAGADVNDGGAGFDIASYYGSKEGVIVNLETGTASGGYAEGDTFIDIEGLMGSRDHADELYGDAGNNKLYGHGGDDKLVGGDGDDYLRGYEGADINDGGAGIDIASYYGSTEGVIVNLETGVASGGYAAGDIFINIEGLMGSENHDDELYGDAGDNRLYGKGGNDKLVGGDGDDYLRGYDGNDIIDGGAGADMASYWGSTSGVTIDLETGDASGGYAEGDTLVSIENILSSKHADFLSGDAGNNRLSSSDGDDELYGLDGDDHLLGGSGSDILYGGAGNDLLDGGGGTGVDFLTGGADADTFHFDRGEGTDHIIDFEDDIDTIEFDGFTEATTAANFINDFASQSGDNVIFDLGVDGMLVVENTTIVQIENDVEIFHYIS